MNRELHLVSPKNNLFLGYEKKDSIAWSKKLPDGL
jgi:hypothetical protein